MARLRSIADHNAVRARSSAARAGAGRSRRNCLSMPAANSACCHDQITVP
jgi:hypothetical protein